MSGAVGILSDFSAVIVGYGSIGHRHAQNLRRLGVEQQIVVRRGTNPNPTFQPPPDARVVTSLEEALAQKPDLAIICTPTSLHAPAAIECLTASVPTLVEKPLADCVQSARQVAELAASTGVPAAMAYSLRYHPVYRAARQRLASGVDGTIRYAKAWFETFLPHWHPWEDYRQSYAARLDQGGGAARTLDHEIDFLNWCLGEPRRASGLAIATGALQSDADDVAALTLEYLGPVAAQLLLSLCRRPPARGFEFVSDAGTLVGNFAACTLEFCPPDGPVETVWSQPEYDLNDMYLDMLCDVLNDLIRGSGERNSVPVSAGVMTLQVSEACRTPAGGAGGGPD